MGFKNRKTARGKKINKIKKIKELKIIESKIKKIEENKNNSDPLFYLYGAKILPDSVKTFLKNGGDVNATYNYDRVIDWKETPLHFAVKTNSVEAVKLLLDAGADANKTSDTNIKPLHLACQSPEQEALEVATLLLDYGADLLAQDDDGSSAIHHAFYARNARLVDMLLARLPKGANPTDYHKLSAFHIACAHGADHVVCDLLDSGVQIDHYTVYNTWLGNRINGLKLAIIDNRKSTVELLLQRGADVKSTEMLLHLACECNYEKFVAHCNGQYVEMRKDMNVSQKNHLGIINFLLDQGLDINATDKNGLTPLLHMCTDRFTSQFAWRVPLVLREPSSREYLHIMIRRDRVFKCLLERGAAVNPRRPDGRGVIHHEVVGDPRFFNAGILNLFVKHGADVNARDERGFTPLHLILDEASKNKFETSNVQRGIEQLLANGADLYARTADGQTPFALYMKNFVEREKKQRICKNQMVMLMNAKQLQMLGLTINDREMRNVLKSIDFGVKEKRCAEELARMKREYVGDTSLYRLLHSGLNVARQSLDESKLQEIMVEMKISEKYPYYARLFKVRVRRGAILQRAESAMKLIARCELPYLCTEEIIKYLADSDLKNLAEIAQNNSEKAEL